MSITLVFPVGYKPVLKHGEHEQSSHGNWALGNFDEETEGENAQNLYYDKYGLKFLGEGRKDPEPVGISREEISSLDRYTGDGYKSINSMLRGQKMEPGYLDNADERRQINEERIADLDKLIEEAPNLFGDKNLYRVFAEDVLSSIKEGDVLTDKAYLSTTRVDITNPANVDVLQNLQMISETNDRTGIILPSPSKSGKGLAVDYLKFSVQDLATNVPTASREKEVLLPRNTSLKFMGYQKVNVGTDNVMEVAVFQRMDK